MKYQKFFYFFISSLLLLTSVVSAQQPNKPKRPVKNPPQYPNIIDLENKDQPSRPQPTSPPAGQENPPETPAVQQSDALVRAVMSLVGELKTMTQEVRSLNIRNQAQLDTLKLTRIDMRIDHYERELRPVRDRLAFLENEENTLAILMTRESLLAQTANVATFNRDELMKQYRLQHETRLRAVQAEKERLRKLEADLSQSLTIYQKLGGDTEQRIQEVEGILKQLEGNQPSKADSKVEKKQ